MREGWGQPWCCRAAGAALILTCLRTPLLLRRPHTPPWARFLPLRLGKILGLSFGLPETKCQGLPCTLYAVRLGSACRPQPVGRRAVFCHPAGMLGFAWNNWRPWGHVFISCRERTSHHAWRDFVSSHPPTYSHSSFARYVWVWRHIFLAFSLIAFGCCTSH